MVTSQIHKFEMQLFSAHAIGIVVSTVNIIMQMLHILTPSAQNVTCSPTYKIHFQTNLTKKIKQMLNATYLYHEMGEEMKAAYSIYNI